MPSRAAGGYVSTWIGGTDGPEHSVSQVADVYRFSIFISVRLAPIFSAVSSAQRALPLSTVRGAPGPVEERVPDDVPGMFRVASPGLTVAVAGQRKTPSAGQTRRPVLVSVMARRRRVGVGLRPEATPRPRHLPRCCR